jgi:hypothetical protein
VSGDHSFEIGPTVEGQIRVVLIYTYRPTRRFYNPVGNQQIRIEVLEPEDLRVIAGGLRHHVDPEAWYLGQSYGPSHRLSLTETETRHRTLTSHRIRTVSGPAFPGRATARVVADRVPGLIEQER